MDLNQKQNIYSADQRVNNAYLQQRKNNSKIIKAIKYIDGQDPSLVIKGLNTITQRTYELADSSSIQLEAFPELILSLGSLLDVVNPIALHFDKFGSCSDHSTYVLNRPKTFWNTDTALSSMAVEIQVRMQCVAIN